MRKRILVKIIQSHTLRNIFIFTNMAYLMFCCFGSVIMISYISYWWQYLLWIVIMIPCIFTGKTQEFTTKCHFRDFKKKSPYYKSALIRNLKQEGLIS